MTDELKENVKSKILQYQEGTQSETNKFEVKRQWHNLRDEQGKNEFLRDITAIVNSYGGEDAFIVFGIDDNTKEIYQASVNDSGYNDAAQIKDIIDSNIDAPIRFDIDTVIIDGKPLSILHLPPSTEKPHYVLKYRNDKNQVYRNVIFIRSGSAKTGATKSDVDRMYVERRNIIVERKLEVSINISELAVLKSKNQGYYLHHPITIENTGMRVVAIAKVEVELLHGTKRRDYQNIPF